MRSIPFRDLDGRLTKNLARGVQKNVHALKLRDHRVAQPMMDSRSRTSQDCTRVHAPDCPISRAVSSTNSRRRPVGITVASGGGQAVREHSPDSRCSPDHHGYAARKIQEVAPALLVLPVPGISGGVGTGSTGVVENNLSNGRSFFESVSVRMEHRLSHGLSVIGDYMF